MTEAFVGSGATVTADGNGAVITTNDGTFQVVFSTGTPLPGEVETPGFVKGLHDVLAFVFDNDITPYLLGFVVTSPPPDDGSYDGRRRAQPNTVDINGLAVTAVSRDAVATDSSGFAAAIGTAPEISAGGTYVHNRTSAYIDASAHVNPVTTGAAAAQQVFVAAGSDSFHQAVAGSASFAADLTLGIATDLALFDNLTEAFVGQGATVNAEAQVDVQAHATEDMFVIVGGVAASFLDVAGSVPVASIRSKAHAFIDQNAHVVSNGNVLVKATDDTDSDLFASNASIGLLGGVGSAAGATFIVKETKAWIAPGAFVDAFGLVGGFLTGPNGTVDSTPFPTTTSKGLAVLAASTETPFNLMASAGTGLFGIGVSGAISFTLVDSDTSAFIDGAHVNTLPCAACAFTPNQRVVVAATNDSREQGFGVNLSGASLGLAGGIDIGIVRNDTKAYIAGGADVRAFGAIDIYALSNKNIASYVGGVGLDLGGLFALQISLSVYALGSFTPSTGDLAADVTSALVDAVSGAPAAIDDAITNALGGVGNGTVNVLNRYASAVGGNQAAATKLANASPSSPATNAIDNTTATAGVAAFVDGSTLHAGAIVELQAIELVNVLQNTSWTFAIDVGETEFPAINLDAAVIVSTSTAAAYIANNSTVVAGIVELSSSSKSEQTLTSTVALNTSNTSTSTYIDGSTVTSNTDVKLTAAASSHAGYHALMPGGDTAAHAHQGVDQHDPEHDRHAHLERRPRDGPRPRPGRSDVTLTSTDTTDEPTDISVISIAARIAGIPLIGAKSASGIGVSFAKNSIHNTLTAHIDGAGTQVAANAGDVKVTATSAAGKTSR